MEHVRVGSGEPVVLVHGIGGSYRSWGPVLGLLAEHMEVWSVSLPGHGGPDDGTPARVVAYAQRLERFFAEQGLDRPHVIGNSTGGGIALELARRGSVRTCVANSPIGFYDDRELAWLIGSLKGSVLLYRSGLLEPQLRTRLGRRLALRIGFADAGKLSYDEAMDTYRTIAASPRFADTLAEFRAHRFTGGHGLEDVPVTVAWGDKDLLLTYRTQSARARAALPWARHVTLAGCGHVPHWDDPEQVAHAFRFGTLGAR